MSSTARKHMIIRGSRPVSEIASEIADAVRAHTDEVAALAGAVAYLAAAKHSETAGEQRQLGAAIYHTAKQRFGGLNYDGVEIGAATMQQLDAMWSKMAGRRK